MKVVERDDVVQGMLRDELKRCGDMVQSLSHAMASLPKGSLHVRKKWYKDREYRYYYLKYRDGQNAISKHIPKFKYGEVKKKLELRKKYDGEVRAYQRRIAYLEKIILAGNRGRRGKNHK